MLRKIIIVVLTLAAALVVSLPVALRYRAIETSVVEAYAVKSMHYSVLGVWWKVDHTGSKGRQGLGPSLLLGPGRFASYFAQRLDFGVVDRIDGRWRYVIIEHQLLIALAAVVGAFPIMAFLNFAYVRHRLYRRRKLGLCVPCGYDVRGSPERCPECGTKIESK